MSIRVITEWPTFVDDHSPPTYRIRMDGLTLAGVYATKAEAQALADRYERASIDNAHDEWSPAS